MCESVVTRAPIAGEAIFEYRTKEGNWTDDPQQALKTSEEDAKAIVRTLRMVDRPPAEFNYDEKIVAD